MGTIHMLPIDLDVTRSVRAYMASCLDSRFSLEQVHAGLRDAAWYSAKDRRVLRAICDEHPQQFTRWLYERACDGRYTGLIMVWPAGHATPIHDHAGLWGIEMVLQGALSVEDYELAGDNELRHVGTSVLDEVSRTSSPPFRGQKFFPCFLVRFHPRNGIGECNSTNRRLV